MDTVIGMQTTRLRAVTLKAHQGLDALRDVAKLAPNVAVVRVRAAQEGRVEVSRG